MSHTMNGVLESWNLLYCVFNYRLLNLNEEAEYFGVTTVYHFSRKATEAPLYREYISTTMTTASEAAAAARRKSLLFIVFFSVPICFSSFLSVAVSLILLSMSFRSPLWVPLKFVLSFFRFIENPLNLIVNAIHITLDVGFAIARMRDNICYQIETSRDTFPVDVDT